jgi:hypothetical protein
MCTKDEGSVAMDRLCFPFQIICGHIEVAKRNGLLRFRAVSSFVRNSCRGKRPAALLRIDRSNSYHE